MSTTLKSCLSEVKRPDQTDHATKHCMFRIRDDYFCIAAAEVSEIILLPEIAQIPDTDPALLGVCHLKTSFLPVISLLNLVSTEIASNAECGTKLLILRGNSASAFSKYAIVITDACGLVTIPLKGHISTEQRNGELLSKLFSGTTVYKEQIVRVLEPARFYGAVTERLERSWSRESLCEVEL